MNVNQQLIPHPALNTPRSNRRGITLLFVISMIVLFLLMGTTFVVVSNDYLRGARRRNINGGTNAGAITREEGQRLVVQSFYEVVRGPSLTNERSPLRFQDLLGDMYGFGIEAKISDVPANAPALHDSEQFVRIVIEFDYSVATPVPEDFPRSLLTGERLMTLFHHDEEAVFPKPGTYIAPAPAEPESPIPGFFNGRLITVTSGAQVGLTARIFQSRAVTTNIGIEEHTFIVQPLFSDRAFDVADLAGETIVINGRAFSGTGFGQYAVDAEVGEPALEGPASLSNCSGQSLAELFGERRDATGRIAALPTDGVVSTFRIDPTTGVRESQVDSSGNPYDVLYPNPKATNEPWDAIDSQNMLLAGLRDLPPAGGSGNEVIDRLTFTDFNGDGMIGADEIEFVSNMYQGDMRFPASFPPNVPDPENRREVGTDTDNDGLISADEMATVQFELTPSFLRPETIVGVLKALEQLQSDMDPATGLPLTSPYTTMSPREQWNMLRNRSFNTDFRALGNLPASVDPSVVPPSQANVLQSLVNSIAVDNDNDGINDGMWIDAGLPIRSTPDGEYIKPLVSFLVLDMDGRLNINAHGNLSESDTPNMADVLGTPGVTSFPRGLGFGPAEVSLAAVLPPQTVSIAGLNSTHDIANRILNARYSNARGTESLPGQSGTGANAIRLDGKARYAFAGYPAGLTGGHFGSPLDLYGRTGLGVLNAPLPPGAAPGTPAQLYAYPPGFPSFSGTPSPPTSNQLANSPYEIDLLSAVTSNDVIFDASDLERLMRPSDRDSVLLSARLDGNEDNLGDTTDTENSRLAPLFSDNNTTTASSDEREFFRKLLTTHSYEVPAIPQDINKRLYDQLTVAEPQKAALMAMLLSPEVRRGLPMDINRIFGDGKTNDTDNIIDEYGETESDVKGIGESTTVDMDVDNDGMPDTAFSGLFARNNFARRLFVLMVLLTEYEDRNGDGRIDFTNDFYDFNGDGSTTEEDWVDHRKMLAQWCANVVDFRDRDSIMTPFEFDLDPFDGWGDPAKSNRGMEGFVSATPEPLGSFASGEPKYFVAWGMERPELLITETSALHDRRTEDLNSDPSGNETSSSPPDPHFDNRYVPIASAFFELYNPWRSGTSTAQSPSTPIELSASGSTTLGSGVDMTRLAPAAPSGVQAPVWRLVIVDPFGLNPSGSGVARYSADFEEQIDTQLVSLSSGGGAAAAINRIVYFTEPTGPSTGIDGQFNGDRVYYPDSTFGRSTSLLSPGQYAVIGSSGVARAAAGGGPTSYVTYLGRRTGEAGKAPDDPPLVAELDLTQRIELDPASSTVTVAGDSRTSVLVFPINTVANDGMSSTTANLRTRSLGLSDPIFGYDDRGTIPTSPVLDDEGNPADGQYFDDGTGTPGTPGMPITIDVPVDLTAAGSTTPGPDWAQSAVNRDGLTTGYRIALLQRLADPTRAYNQNNNPYRTIDSSSVDLFAFNGLEDDSARPDAGTGIARGGTEFRPDALGTFERGEERTPGPEAEGLLWRTSVAGEIRALKSDDPRTGATAPSDHRLNQPYINSLGTLNEFYENNVAGGHAFPWLTWNNRPFANQYELVNVPYTSAGWLTRVFGVGNYGSAEKPFSANGHAGAGGTTPERGTLFYELRNDPDVADIRLQLQKIVHPNAVGFTHLLNFGAEDQPGTPLSDRMHVAMDFLEVPSRFIGTREYVNTGEFDSTAAGAWPAVDALDYSLTAPFDELNSHRYPGKINLNTISSQKVWNAVLGSRNPATPGPYATAFDFSTWADSLVGNPLRPATASNNVSGSTVPGSANAGLFRSDDANRENGDSADVGTDFMPGTPTAALNPDRNSYFRNGLRQRLGGVATNRSSVYAIWVTVGYFEWDAENNSLRDLARDGIEYGTETGTVQRNRGFFLFDRSIPMAYEPGQNHNIDRGVLLQSLIE